MKRNWKYKILIALLFLVVLAALIIGFFVSRSGDGSGVQSAYHFTTTTTTTKKADAKKDSKKTETVKSTKKADKSTKTTTAADGKKRIVVPGTYVSILNKYQDALQNKSKIEALRKAGISTLLPELYEGKPLENVGFYVDDFNGDGSTDLIIGVVDGYSHYPYAILDYYTLDNNGKALNVFQSQPKDYYTACTNARILEKASDGGAYTAWYLYGLNSNGMSLTFKEGLLRDRTANADKPWFKASDLDGDTGNDKHVSNDAGKTRQKQLDNARVQLKYLDFTKYNRTNKAK